jgi:hypothetical protein
MKKILIPIIGLLVLIILTPIFLGKIANSNIDDKIKEFQKAGIIINEESKEVSYLNTKRVFEVELNQDTNIKDWNEYKKFIKDAKFLVTLTFKNLPITKANFDIEIKGIDAFNKTLLKGLNIHLVTKNFKSIDYKIDNYNKDNIILNNVYGNIKIDKYKTYIINAKNISTFFISLIDSKMKFIVKSLELSLVDVDLDIKEIKLKDRFTINIKNLKEHFEVHLSGDKKYTINDISKIKSLSIDKIVAFGDIDSNLSIKENNMNWLLKWNQTQLNTIVDGGEIEAKGKISKNIDDLDVDIDVSLSKSLYEKLSIKLNPDVLNRYFKDYKSHIKINKGIFVNGNRIQ